MDVFLMDYTQHRGVKAREWSGAARGPPSQTTWKGMGPSGYHRPPSLQRGFWKHLLLLCILILISAVDSLMPVAGQTGCGLDRCSDNYMSNQDSNNTCAALRTYHHCIIKLKKLCETGDITYYTVRQIVRNQMKKHNCTTIGHTLEELPPPPSRRPEVPAACMYQGRPVYKYCGLFGDPHLRTFNDQVQTCKVKGARPLVNNDYLTVQVTNDLVLGSMDATAVSKLTVIVKGNSECTSKDFQTYQAQTGELPDTFEDGRVTVGPYRSLEIEEVEPDSHVRIHIRYIHTEINIRQIGLYFTFSIKMPEDLINRTSGSSIHDSSANMAMEGGSGSELDLCVRGCPVSEQIDYGEYIARYKISNRAQNDQSGSGEGSNTQEPVLSREYSERLCKESELVDFYFDSCVFDLMTTGDENFTVSAKKALQDMVRLNPSVVRTMVNRTDLHVYDERYNAQRDGGSNSAVSVYPAPLGWRTSCQRQQMFVLVLCLTFMFTLARYAVR